MATTFNEIKSFALTFHVYYLKMKYPQFKDRSRGGFLSNVTSLKGKKMGQI